jgi:hypothetical protein
MDASSAGGSNRRVVLNAPIKLGVSNLRAVFFRGATVSYRLLRIHDRVLLGALFLLASANGTNAADGLTVAASGRQNSILVEQQPANPETLPPAAPAAGDRLRPIDQVELTLGARQEILPRDLAAERFGPEEAVFQPTGSSRLWGDSVYAWDAPALCHRPLYFEEENLERYGRSYGLLQPAVSVAHFSGRVAALPYLAGAFPPHECIYTLGRTPPGSYEPYHWYRPPVSARGAVLQAGAVTGLIFLVP